MSKLAPSTSQSPLAGHLAGAAAIKADMLRLLHELEAAATAKPPATAGTWRHHPTDWSKEHPPKNT